MPARPKLSLEEKVALALDIIRRARPAREICRAYGVSHTTAYEIREAFVQGGREWLRLQRPERRIEERLRQLERALLRSLGDRSEVLDGSS
jgi:transposase-like protein